MSTLIGPYPISKIVLCSADAGPDSQRNEPREAGYFFRDGRWVGTFRNASKRLKCRFVILTTEYGLVNPDDVIRPYDAHISTHKLHVANKWNETIPRLLGKGQYDLMVFYSGGCPREAYLEILLPILRLQGISLITFGMPNVHDVGKIDQFVRLLTSGTSLDELRSILKLPLSDLDR